MNRIIGQPISGGTESSGIMRSPAITSAMTSPTVPPASSAGWRRRSSSSMPETARIVRRPKTPPRT